MIVGAGGVVTAGGLGLWMIKSWITKVDRRLDRLFDEMNLIKLNMAERKGEVDGKDTALWRDINSQKVNLAKLESKVDKAWEVVHKIAQPRISDMLNQSIKESE